jgi:hypothetical protein
MGSQSDLDQGGTVRETVATYMGPSVGWIYAPARSVLQIAVAGTFVILASTTLVTINTAGAVILTLPTALNPTVPAGAQPGPYVKSIITIVDIGGAPNILIEPFSGAETIMGLASIKLLTPYGSYSLRPGGGGAGAAGTWTAAQ